MQGQPTFSSSGEKWGIYTLDLLSGEVNLLYGTVGEISNLDLDIKGTKLVFSEQIGGPGYEFTEIQSYSIPDHITTRLTDNEVWDLYPVWSPDGTQIVYLSFREETLDIYLMEADGSQQRLLFDSGFHDADIDWVGGRITFTSQSRIWIMEQDGSNPMPLTTPPQAGEWGLANLPFGDYDPRISPDGSMLVFSRLLDDKSPHGNYDLFRMNIDGQSLVNLTETGYSQGLSNWSPEGDRILYIVSAKDEQGFYDLYSIRGDGSEITNLTPDYLSPNFLIHSACFAPGGTTIYFIGQWWSDEN
jgi:Tol biopolymer transport system component